MRTLLLVALVLLAGCDMSSLEDSRPHHIDRVKSGQTHHHLELTYPNKQRCEWKAENWAEIGAWCHRE